MKTRLLLLFALLLQINSLWAARVDTIQVKAHKMNKQVKNVVILPEDYSESSHYPVLYLLHGATDNYRSWIIKCPEIKDYADRYQMIIVCPDGGYTSWYFDSPIDKKMQYESYITKDLVSFVDKNYATIEKREGRAILGLSMGGHGALYLAFRHQDMWSIAGSMSGGVDFTPFPLNWDIPKRLGAYAANRERWEKNTVIDQVYLLTPHALKIKFDCGREDFFFNVNNALHKKLDYCNIPHEFTVRPGNHNWDYWRNAIKYQLIFIDDCFKHPSH